MRVTPFWKAPGWILVVKGMFQKFTTWWNLGKWCLKLPVFRVSCSQRESMYGVYIPGTGLSIILMKGLSLRKSWNPETWKYKPLIKTQSFGFSPKIGNFQVGWFSIIFGMVIRWNPKTSQGEGLSAIFCSIAKLESSSHPLTPRCQQPGQVNATHQIKDIS